MVKNDRLKMKNVNQSPSTFASKLLKHKSLHKAVSSTPILSKANPSNPLCDDYKRILPIGELLSPIFPASGSSHATSKASKSVVVPSKVRTQDINERNVSDSKNGKTSLTFDSNSSDEELLFINLKVNNDNKRGTKTFQHTYKKVLSESNLLETNSGNPVIPHKKTKSNAFHDDHASREGSDDDVTKYLSGQKEAPTHESLDPSKVVKKQNQGLDLLKHQSFSNIIKEKMSRHPMKIHSTKAATRSPVKTPTKKPTVKRVNQKEQSKVVEVSKASNFNAAKSSREKKTTSKVQHLTSKKLTPKSLPGKSTNRVPPIGQASTPKDGTDASEDDCEVETNKKNRIFKRKLSQNNLKYGSPSIITELDFEQPKLIPKKAKKRSYGEVKKAASRIPRKTSTEEDLVVRKSSRQQIGTIRFWEQRLNYVYIDGVATIDTKKPITEIESVVVKKEVSKAPSRFTSKLESPSKLSGTKTILDAVQLASVKLKALSQETFCCNKKVQSESVLLIKPSCSKKLLASTDMLLNIVSGEGFMKTKKVMHFHTNRRPLKVDSGDTATITNESSDIDFLIYVAEFENCS